MIINSYTIPPYKFMNNFINDILDDSVYLDIETTGLSSKINTIISITLIITDDGNLKLYQIFAESPESEEATMNEFYKLIKDKKYLITYNGNTFDIPFLSFKLNKYNIRSNLNAFNKIDLYKDIRVLHSKLSIENMKLKTIEKYFCIQRNDTLSGADIIKLYNAYQLNNKREHMELILLHNYEDVYNLPLIFDNILDLYDKCIYNSYSDDFLFVKIINKNIIINKKQIRINLDMITAKKIGYLCHGSYFDFNHASESNIANIKLYPQMFKDNNSNELLYLTSSDVKLCSFTSIKSLRSDIIPLKLNQTLFYNNMYAIIDEIIKDIIK